MSFRGGTRLNIVPRKRVSLDAIIKPHSYKCKTYYWNLAVIQPDATRKECQPAYNYDGYESQVNYAVQLLTDMPAVEIVISRVTVDHGCLTEETALHRFKNKCTTKYGPIIIDRLYQPIAA